MNCFLLLLLPVLFYPFNLSESQDKQPSDQKAHTAGEPLFLTIRNLAERTENEDSTASAQADKLISKVDDPRALFNLIVKLRERELFVSRKYDGVCNICLRYFGAYISAMHTLSKLNTDEAADHLVRLMTVETCDWQAMPMKNLLYNISLMGKRTLPHLEALRGKHPLAETIIEVVRRGEIFW